MIPSDVSIDRNAPAIHSPASDDSFSSLGSSDDERWGPDDDAANEVVDADTGRVVGVADLTFMRTLGSGSYGRVKLAMRKKRMMHKLRKSLQDLSGSIIGQLSPTAATSPLSGGADNMEGSRRSFRSGRSGRSGRSRGGDDDQELYAVKIFSKSILKRMRTMTRDGPGRRLRVSTALDKVYAEVALMKKLNHPNIVELHDVYDSEEMDAMYMVLEYVTGGEIMSYDEETRCYYRKQRTDGSCVASDAAPQPERPVGDIEGSMVMDGPYDEAAAALFFVDILHGLAYLHSNLYLPPRPQAEKYSDRRENQNRKITDFGVSHFFEAEARAITPTASPTSSPERPPTSTPQHNDETNSRKHEDAMSMASMGTSDACPVEAVRLFEGCGDKDKGYSDNYGRPCSLPATAESGESRHVKDVIYELRREVADDGSCVASDTAPVGDIEGVDPPTQRRDEQPQTRGRHVHGFWSPEMCDGRDSFSGYAADMWAAGICLYIFVTGRVPFHDDNPATLFEKIAEGKVLFLTPSPTASPTSSPERPPTSTPQHNDETNSRKHEDAMSMASMGHLGRLSKTEGTYCFWSPEMCDGRDSFSGYAADMWAAGICLYVFVTGRVPFHDDNPATLFEKIAEGKVLLFDTMSPDLKSMLRMLLQRDHEKRAGVGDCLKHPFLKKAVKKRREAVPFHDDNPATLFEKIAEGRVLLFDTMSPDLKSMLLQRLLQRDHEKRAGVGDCLKHPFLKKAVKKRREDLSKELSGCDRQPIKVSDAEKQAAITHFSKAVIVMRAADKLQKKLVTARKIIRERSRSIRDRSKSRDRGEALERERSKSTLERERSKSRSRSIRDRSKSRDRGEALERERSKSTLERERSKSTPKSFHDKERSRSRSHPRGRSFGRLDSGVLSTKSGQSLKSNGTPSVTTCDPLRDDLRVTSPEILKDTERPRFVGRLDGKTYKVVTRWDSSVSQVPPPLQGHAGTPDDKSGGLARPRSTGKRREAYLRERSASSKSLTNCGVIDATVVRTQSRTSAAKSAKKTVSMRETKRAVVPMRTPRSKAQLAKQESKLTTTSTSDESCVLQ
eukprot:CAMPEP_0194346216 /NCGR_PEP_ID=MMETSP0171-20130528/105297_1 /TAXON_ID=218684 /ORGANISM="Corethron pennatum, Strain L29A3" /LENGTH=1068 /DNA_ID=CAMNT_0039113313 /DNA_START=164 /DNA_END=3377 /DNA_ORIENTATION=+